MPSTEPNITRPVDGCSNQNRGKPCFRYVAHETMKIAVRIEMIVISNNAKNYHEYVEQCVIQNS